MQKVAFDLSWGDPVAIREYVLDICKEPILTYPIIDVSKMGYLPHHRPISWLSAWCQAFVKETTGINYKHIVLVPGASAGIAVTLRAAAALYGHDAVRHDALYFPMYPAICSSSGLKPSTVDNKTIVLTASPSNPTGEVTNTHHSVKPLFNVFLRGPGSRPFYVWDAAYHTPSYSNRLNDYPYHDVAIGSFSKLLGLPGARVGWVATNDAAMADKVWNLSTELFMGHSALSEMYLTTFLKRAMKSGNTMATHLKWAGERINDNREELARLEYLMEDGTVPETGMFFFARPSDALFQYMDRCLVSFTAGNLCGGDHDQARLSLGQNRELTRKAVQKILKADGK